MNEPGLIVLYDIPSKLESRCWSINMWKARLVLNYKGLPYRTEWISYPDVEPIFKKLGIPPSMKKNYNDQDHYTCPSIIDYTVTPEAKVTESLAIAQYLDDKYSSEEKYGPRLFPEGTKDAQLTFYAKFVDGIGYNVVALCLGSVPAIIEDPRGAEYFEASREKMKGRPLSQFFAAGSSERKEAWDALREGLNELAMAYDKNEEGRGEYLFGKNITFADMVVVAAFLWARITPVDRDGPESKYVWDTVKTWNGGRWERLVEKFEKYLHIK
ncbi:hypothetical protein FRB95_000244 [Tulasnella sp. JGI-2019a]|nr:hypothetical protein FRB93_004202 [Tulasnella sp. JGI-2019a]KAG9038655.1 hypothetical protein FRB95_000244 [Tulasnella sp. JGI-2019a]